ncbi:MAG: hypothetical protein U5K75_06205 [Ahrensia sp.]|nr:hypothetical protein [Ahrensia sp.]
MAKFARQFIGVKKGDIYPTEFKQGEVCPDELEDAARLCSAIDGTKEYKKPTSDK